MSKQKCGHCARLTTAGFICPDCKGKVMAVLADVPAMVDELRTALSRQAKFASTGGPSSDETPVAFNTRASEVSGQYQATLLKWQGRLADHLQPGRFPRGQTPPPYRVSEPVRFLQPIAAAAWMWQAIRTRGVASWQDAPRMVAELVDVAKKAAGAIAAPPPLEYLGDCTLKTDDGVACKGRVYAEPGAVDAVCNLCGGWCDAQTARLGLLAWMDNRIMTAAEIARAAAYLDLGLNREQVRKRINQWHSRGQLQPRRLVAPGEVEIEDGADTDGAVPTFRFADAHRLLVNDKAHRKGQR